MSELVKAEQATVKVTVILNPLRAREENEQFYVPFEPNTKISDYITDVADAVVAYKGKVVEGDLSIVEVEEHTEIIVCPIPHGSNNPIGRIVAFMAVAVVAAMTAGAALGAFGTVAGGAFTTGSLVMAYAVQTAVMIGGALLINELMPFDQPKNEESPTYSLSGPQNTGREGMVVPVVYGKHIMAGNRIANHVQNLTAQGTQIFYALYNLGEGEIGGVADVKINDQPIGNYKDVEYVVRTGTGNQDIIPWFGDTVTPVNASVTLTNASWYTFNTNQIIDAFSADFLCPSGLYDPDDEGGLHPATTAIQIRFRKVGDTEWVYAEPSIIGYQRKYVIRDYPTNGEYNSLPSGYYCQTVDGEPNYLGVYKLVNTPWPTYSTTRKYVGFAYDKPIYGAGENGATDVDGNFYYTITAQVTNPFSFTLTVGNTLVQGMYEIQFRMMINSHTGHYNNETSLVTVNQITFEDIKYKHTALLAIKVKLTDQLSGLPNVTLTHLGRVFKVRSLNNVTKEYEWSETNSANPAWIVYDILTNRRFGGGYNEADIDVDKFQEWADFCDYYGFEFNGVFDTSTNVWDAVASVARCGFGSIVLLGTKYTVTIDKAETPSMLFSDANILKGTTRLNWLPFSERANEVIMEFFDSTNGYKNRTVKLADPDLPPNEIQKTVTLDAFGISTVEQATRHAAVQMNKNRRQLKTITFEASLDAIAVGPGDVFAYQSSVMEWGAGGKLLTGSTTTVLNLDTPVTLEPLKTYKATVHYDYVVRASGTINSVLGTYVYLNGYTGAWPVRTLKVGINEYRVLDVVDNGAGLYGVQINAAIMPAPGAAYQLYDLDVVEQRDVVNPGVTNEYSSITLSSALPVAPSAGQKWIFGLSDQIIEKYRVIKMSNGSQGYSRTIDAIQYDDEIYNYPETVLGIEPIDGYGQPAHVTNLGYTLGSRLVGRNTATYVRLSWGLPATGTYGGAKIHASYGGSPFALVGSVDKGVLSWEDHTTSVSDTVVYRVVAFDALGATATILNAPTVSVAVASAATAHPAVTLLMAIGGEGKVSLTWEDPANNPTNISHYEIWRNTVNTRDGNETLVGGSIVRYFDDVVAPGTYYYWVRTVDTSDIPGAWHSAVGVMGVATPVAVGSVGADDITPTATPLTAPSSVSAVAGFQNIILMWTNPIHPYLGNIEVWASPSNDRTTASVVYRGKAEVFSHYVGRGVGQYYWLRSVDMWGVASGYHAADNAGLYAITNNQILEGDLAANSVTAAKIVAGTITGDKIAAGTITASNIAAATITAVEIAADAITATEIAANAITTEKIAAYAVTADEIAAGAIIASKIAAGSITATHVGTNQIVASSANLADAVVGTAKIANLAVDTLRIQDQAVTVSMSAGSLTTTYNWQRTNTSTTSFTYLPCFTTWVSGNPTGLNWKGYPIYDLPVQKYVGWGNATIEGSIRTVDVEIYSENAYVFQSVLSGLLNSYGNTPPPNIMTIGSITFNSSGGTALLCVDAVIESSIREYGPDGYNILAVWLENTTTGHRYIGQIVNAGLASGKYTWTSPTGTVYTGTTNMVSTLAPGASENRHVRKMILDKKVTITVPAGANTIALKAALITKSISANPNNNPEWDRDPLIGTGYLKTNLFGLYYLEAKK